MQLVDTLDGVPALLQALIGELTIASPEFARWWQDHRVYQRTYGEKSFRHPVVGDLTLQYETFTMPGDPDQALFLHSAEPGTASRQALGLLASWTLTGAPGLTR